MKVVHPGKSGQAVGCDTQRRDRRIARMNIHKNARLTPSGRLLLVQRIEGAGWRLAEAGRGKDRRRRPASAGAQRPCGGPTRESPSPKEGTLSDLLDNLP